MESLYEYGSRAGVWRILRAFDATQAAAHGLRRRHGARAPPRGGRRVHAPRPRDRQPRLRWIQLPARARGDRARAPRHAAVAMLTRADRRRRRSAGTPAATARTRAASSSSTAASRTTADYYADDLPFWTEVDSATARGAAPGRARTRSTPTTCASSQPQGFNTGEQFFTYLSDAFDVLYAEGDPPARPAEDDVDRPALPASSASPARIARAARASSTTCRRTTTSGSPGASTSPATGAPCIRMRASAAGDGARVA